MSFQLIEPPALEPVAVSALKSRLRLSGEEHDARLQALIVAARQRVEQESGLVLISQTWLERRDRWDGDGRLTAFATQFRMLKPPLRAIEKITVFDADDRGEDWDPDAYFVDAASHPGRLLTRPGMGFPVPGRALAGIRIRFVAGYGETPESVPAPLGLAVELLAASLFAQEEQTVLPLRIASLIAPWRRLSL